MSQEPILLVALYTPEREVELLLLRSVFEGSGIDFFITNDTFGAMTAAPQAALYNRRTLLVAEDQLDEARGLLEEFLGKVAHTVPPPPPPSFWRHPWQALRAWLRPAPAPPEPPRLRLVRGGGPDRPVPPALNAPDAPASKPGRPPLRIVRDDRDRDS